MSAKTLKVNGFEYTLEDTVDQPDTVTIRGPQELSVRIYGREKAKQFQSDQEGRREFTLQVVDPQGGILVDAQGISESGPAVHFEGSSIRCSLKIEDATINW